MTRDKRLLNKLDFHLVILSFNVGVEDTMTE